MMFGDAQIDWRCRQVSCDLVLWHCTIDAVGDALNLGLDLFPGLVVSFSLVMKVCLIREE